MVGQKVLAIAVHTEIPGLVFDINGDMSVHHEPTQVVEILAGRRRVDGNREIPTAESRAIGAQHFAVLQIVALNGKGGHGSIVKTLQEEMKYQTRILNRMNGRRARQPEANVATNF